MRESGISRQGRTGGQCRSAWRAPWWPLLLAPWLAGCGGGDDGDLTGPGGGDGIGSLRVTTTTVHSALDPDGFTLRVGTDAARGIGVGDTLEIPGLEAGSHAVELGGLATGCTVAGSARRDVVIRADRVTSLDLSVTCTLRGRLVYVQGDRSGVGDLYAAEPDGSSPVRLASHPASDDHPAVSPDGMRIAFRSTRDGSPDIFVADADGTDPVNLTASTAYDAHPAWSPDGARIAFTSSGAGVPDIWVMDADGSNLRNLTSHPRFDFEPTWSPDGARIAFVSERENGQEIFVMDTDGTDVVRVSHGGGDYARPAWAPDGARIAYTAPGAATGADRVWVMDADGRNPLQLTDGGVFGGIDRDPAWTGDGARIAFGSFRTGVSEIFTVGADGSELRQVTRGDANRHSYDPAFGW